MKKYYVICMSFDGEYQKESPLFDSIQDAWDYANDLGSKWYFYPFTFVCSGVTISDSPELIPHFIGKRIATTKKLFNKVYNLTKDENLDVYDYMWRITEHIHEHTLN